MLLLDVLLHARVETVVGCMNQPEIFGATYGQLRYQSRNSDSTEVATPTSM